MSNHDQTLAALVESFEQWRPTRKSRSDLPPEAMREQIRDATKRYGVTRVRGVLGCTASRMKDCLGRTAVPAKTAKRQMRRTPDVGDKPAFTELILSTAVVGGRDEGRQPICVVDSPCGTRMTVYSGESLVCDLVGTFVANLHSNSESRPC
jgi:hypothetical protein